MTSDNYTNNRLNYNSAESAKSLPHVEKLFSTRRKNISYAFAQNILSKELFRTLLVMLLMTVGSIGIWAQTNITSLSAITDADGHYVITQDISGGTPGVTTFNGTLEAAINPDTHMPYKITGLSAPLFTTLTGTVKNLVLEGVSISSGDASGNTGAIACTANGAARIYNVGILSGSVSGSGAVGGLVGWLDHNRTNDGARVINCYSFADITGGSERAGIVGHNVWGSRSKDKGDGGQIRTMVMNCMFYGNISSGGSTTPISPIYGGTIISNEDNDRLNNYNYFRLDSEFSQERRITKYNCALAAEERYLVRFEFYRYLLNSNRELAAFHVDPSPETFTQSNKEHKRYHKSLMHKWVLDKNIAPYPILKEQGYYPSVVNYNDAPEKGTLSITINLGSGYPEGASIHTNYPKTLTIYDKDTTNFHFNAYTVRLPYYNEVGDGNCTHNKVVTGWKITGINAVTNDPYTSANYTGDNYDWPNYNFANRKSSNKDLYSVSGRVFSQGAYFDVPDGVTSITIEPYWGNAAYLSDAYYDSYGYETSKGVTDYGIRYVDGQEYDICGDNNQKVYTSFGNALNSLSGSTVYDNAIVLVGNFHQKSKPSEGDKPFTIMSADMDNDNEPDYSFIYNSGKGEKISPIRFDFVNVPGTAMAHKKTSTTYMGIMGNHKWRGWLEVTNTAFIRFSQLEYDDKDSKSFKAPVILLGGVVEQIVSTNGAAKDLTNTIYFHLGGNVWFKLFNNGCHLDKSLRTPRVPISVTGGDFDKFYLSGYFKPEAPVYKQNAECYISGGRFGELAGAGQELVDGDVTWLIDRADIKNFYGGGINDKKPVSGNISVTIKNSNVGTYCGGPKFGNMSTGKTVTTIADNCKFGDFYGAGFGGTATYRYLWNPANNGGHNKYNLVNYLWNGTDWVGNAANGYTASTRGKYVNGQGILVGYEYEHFEGSNDKTVARLYMYYVSLSLAQTKNVTSTLTGCTIENNFYGGGKLGSVDGNVISNLNGCTIHGNAYGAGYSGTSLPVEVFDAGGFQTIPNYNTSTGVFEKGVYPNKQLYTWSSKGSVTNNSSAGSLVSDDDGLWIHTDVDLTALGTVFGKVTLNIDEGTKVDGNVYGGGEASDATGDVEVNVKGQSITDVFGGGKGETTVVGGDVVVNIGERTGTEGSYTYSGETTIRNVYGGSAFGNTNAKKDDDYNKDTNPNAISAVSGKTTQVNLYKGTVTGSVFGGGLGQRAVAGTPAQGTEGEEGYVPAVPAKPDIVSNVYGPVTVTVEGEGSAGNVFGCNDQNGAPQGTVDVTITSTASVESPATAIGNVYGGGNLASYTGTPIVTMSGGSVNNIFGGGLGTTADITGNTTVTLSGGTVGHDVYGGGNEADVSGTVNVSITGGTVTHDVYGGGALANTNTASTTTYLNTTVSLTGGSIDNVYGGGLGRKADTGVEAVAATSGNVLVELNKDVADNAKGCIVNQIFGANNQNGTPLGTVTVHVYGTQHKYKEYITDNYNPPYYDPNQETGEGLKMYLQRLVNAAEEVTKVDGLVPSDIKINLVNASAAAEAAMAALIAEQAKRGPNDPNLMGREDILPPADQQLISNLLVGTNDNKGPILLLEEALADTKTCFDVQAVYGGGNEAEYKPTDKSGKTVVIIDGCDRTSIRYVYGGGNAAAVPATDVTVNSAKVIDYLFGGGNGERGEAYAANVGYANEEYAGTALTKLIGGTIYHAFGGSNEHGNIINGSSIEMPTPDPNKPRCPLITKEIYGAGQNAEQAGGVKMILGCLAGKPNIYGGSYNATIKGGVTVVITSGEYGQVFGGNDRAGTIQGPIKVSIEETACDPIEIDELYLGGNHAPYSVFGYKEITDPNDNSKKIIVPRTSNDDTEGTQIGMPDKTYSDNQWYADPILNVVSCTRIGKINGNEIGSGVYGGGLGAEATMYGNPTVNLNMSLGEHADEISGDNKLGKITNVYGGGNQAKVEGNTTVNIGTALTAPMETTNGTTSVLGANIIGNVYGGGKEAEVTGNTQVNICAYEETVENTTTTPATTTTEWHSQMTLSDHITIAGDVFGGGQGLATNAMSALVKGNSNVNMGGGWVQRSIYGGGELASVGDFTYTDGKPSAINDKDATTGKAPTGTATVNIFGGKVGPASMPANFLTGYEHTNDVTQFVHDRFIGHVFGAGKGITGDKTENENIPKLNYVNETNVTISGEIVDDKTSTLIMGSVYGGSENGHVLGDTYVTINGGQIGCGADQPGAYSETQFLTWDDVVDNKVGVTTSLAECPHWQYGNNGKYEPYDPFALSTGLYENGESSAGGSSVGSDGHTYYGNVFGGGSGAFPYAAGAWEWDAGAVYGNTNVTINGGHILTSIYGGNELTNVGDVEHLSGGKCTVTFGGTATLGVPRTLTDIANHPVTCYLFGGGKGDQRVLFNKHTNVTDAEVNITGGWIYGSIFGGGEDGHILRDVNMNIGEGAKIGTWGTSYVDGNIFGGGRGFGADAYTAGNVSGSVDIDITGGKILGSIYGGGRLGSVGYGLFPATGEGSANYGKMRPDDKEDVNNATTDFFTTGPNQMGRGHIDIEISGNTVIGNNWEYDYIAPSVTGDALTTAKAKMPLTKHDANNKLTHTKGGNVFTGAMGRRLQLDGETEITVLDWKKLGNVKQTKLTIKGNPVIKSSVYGGCEYGAVTGSDNHTKGTEIDIQGGTIGTAIGTGNNLYYFGNVYGGGMGDVYEEGGIIVKKGGDIGAVDDTDANNNTSVSISGGTVRGNVYGGCEVAHVKGSTNVAISGTATIGVVGFADTSIGNVFGGGQEGDVHGSVDVTMTGGQVFNDIYGGGALANTNTANWNSDAASADLYVEKTGLDIETYEVRAVESNPQTLGLYEKVDNTYTLTSDTSPQSGKQYYKKTKEGSDVNGYYTRLGDNPPYTYTLLTSGKAQGNTIYYEKKTYSAATGISGNWVKTNNDYATTVTLKGGTIGNVYGGGLGNSTTPANVYGDVTVTVNEGTGSNAKFTQHSDTRTFNRTITNANGTTETKEVTENFYTTGRVFGCNNIKGTPLGNVHVTVWSTTPLEGGGHVDNAYEIQEVYGGGNLSPYRPTEGKKTKVDIRGCEETSIFYVFGGGNAAEVPETDVNIHGCYEIETVFGGGNGNEPVKNTSGQWVENPGANVPGISKVSLMGGVIHSAFAGSFVKGTCGVTVIDDGKTGDEPSCLLRVTNMYGGGKDAPVVNGINVNISGCSSGNNDNIENIYAGSYNARISTGVTMNITGGVFKNVFGGNHQGGYIDGPIVINVEETDQCKPIIIDNLYGGGNFAAYPGPGANTTNGKITINIKSCTRIGNVFGGSLSAPVTGDTEININMREGWWAGKPYPTNSTDPEDVIPNGIGTIGNVFGGGNLGAVNGSTTINIGTATQVGIMKRDANGVIVDEYGQPVYDDSGMLIAGRNVVLVDQPVLGANISGNVYGGCNKADVSGNTTVNICAVKSSDTYTSVALIDDGPGKVMIGGSVFGGGNLGSVGTFNQLNTAKPTSCTAKTGTSTVAIMGYAEIGPDNMKMPDDFGHVFGASKGTIHIEDIYTEDQLSNMNEEQKAAAIAGLANIAYVYDTEVTIGGHAFVKGSAYGGGFDGHVLHNTHITIQGDCQIGCGKNTTSRHPDDVWATDYTPTDANNLECAHWEYKSPYAAYDIYDYQSDGKTPKPATDGHTFYGNVFGGGSGYFPYDEGPELTEKQIEEGYAKGVWLRHAGMVEGNTVVDVTGGHILTCMYGGNEQTDVKGSCTINMSGGTLGVPRTLKQIIAHPVTCYVYGAGKGDQRINFNTWTNVASTEVNITGTARVYGSVFGGGEDGHILGNAEIKIGEDNGTPLIGTKGISYVDGNIFGGGRGFSGLTQTAGAVGGNVDINIYGGTMLGSVYGGGRLASVGTEIADIESKGYGQFKEDGQPNAGDKYGYVTINISGGIIGNDENKVTLDGVDYAYGGNVFGGSMGRLTLLNGEMNPIWPEIAQVKETEINITGGTIKRTVYGGSEFGTVHSNTYVTIGGTLGSDKKTVTPSGNPSIMKNVFGGGYGSDNYQDETTINVWENHGTTASPNWVEASYTFTPMQFAGCVGISTNVNICGGKIYNTVYGGGEMASVGIIDYTATKAKIHNDIRGTGRDEKVYNFGLSWPYEFVHIPGYEGTANVTVTGGRIGIAKSATDDPDGDVYGGGKGAPGDRYNYAFCANVKTTNVHINYDDTPVASSLFHVYYDSNENEWQEGVLDKTDDTKNYILGSVYGGAENGHVLGNTNVLIEEGLIGHVVYGGGKGKKQYEEWVKKIGAAASSTLEDNPTDFEKKKIYSITAGRVYGNTNVKMTGGHVIRNVFGGGNMASVGIGNYAGGSDDYSTGGYGELPPYSSQGLWTNTNFTGSGKTKIEVYGGIVGFPNSQKDGMPTGNVYGGCRGTAVPNVDVNLSPRWQYYPEFYAGYVNETEVIIGDADNGPRIYGSVYGGGQDGHVRRQTNVTANKGEIGVAYNETNITALQTAYSSLSETERSALAEVSHFQWRLRGNVFGGGSGLGMYNAGTKENPNMKFSNAAGSVTTNTTVTINNTMDGTAGSGSTPGNIIHANVFGGGSLGTVGPPKIGQPDYATINQTLNHVIIKGTVGDEVSNTAGYGGNVYGASRGASDLPNSYLGKTETSYLEENKAYATTLFTKVEIENGAKVYGDVYGGGKAGDVGGSVEVTIRDGEVGHDLYGGGALAHTNRYNWEYNSLTGVWGTTWADATKKSTKYTTTVNLNGGIIKGDTYGGGLGRLAKEAVGTANSSGYVPAVTAIEAKTYGDILVELNNPTKREEEGTSTKGCIVDHIFGCNNLNGSPQGHTKVHVYQTQNKDKASITAKYPKEGVGDLEKGSKTDKEYLQALIDHATSLGGITVSDYQAKHDSGTDEEVKTAITGILADIAASKKRYDVQGVYGGGDLATYIPVDNNEATEVIIEGCDVTSIYQAYGGSNAAPAPATHLTINSAYEIYEAFGGGNGKDSYDLEGKTYENPGANVGYKNYTHPVWNETNSLYEAVDNTDALTKENRQTIYLYGTGVAKTDVRGGFIHEVYGGSNVKGNIRKTAMSTYAADVELCPLKVGETYGGSKDAPLDGDIELVLDCVKDMDEIFGGSKNSDVNASISLTITNGTFKKVFGGNNTSGAISGDISVTIQEKGCQPIFIEQLYAGGYLAPYSIYGYWQDGETGDYITEPINNIPQRKPISQVEYPGYVSTLNTHKNSALVALELVNLGHEPTQAEIDAKVAANPSLEKYALELAAINDYLKSFPRKDPRINVISATRIDNIFGGGYQALVVGNPRINVNMEKGMIVPEYVTSTTEAGTHGEGDYVYTIEEITDGNEAILALGKIGNIFGGGNEANIDGNTFVDIGTGEWLNAEGNPEIQDEFGVIYSYENDKWGYIDNSGETPVRVEVNEKPIPARKAAQITGNVYGGGNGLETDKTLGNVTGNTNVTIGDGTDNNLLYIEGNVYGGGNLGSVGTFTEAVAADVNSDDLNSFVVGEPKACTSGGTATITITGGSFGKDDMLMTATGKPDSQGHIFGAGKGIVGAITGEGSNALIPQLAYVNETDVTITGEAFVKGSVYGGSQNGHVLNDTHVTIDGNSQIGNGYILLYNNDGTINKSYGINRRYTSEEWAQNRLLNNADWSTQSMPECASWPYGKATVDANKYAPYDKFTNTTGDDGHTFYGNVFGGGSGEEPYASGKWLHTAGIVRGKTVVDIKGGHVLTSIYGGNELTDVVGTTTVNMSGGTLGVPRTLDQIAAHPVTCYLFGGGKGDQRSMFDTYTNVASATVNVTGGTIYGSVFGGAEDGHILGNTTITVEETKDATSGDVITSPHIGTWGTSYVDGNIFGGGRGFSGENLYAGNVNGNVEINFKGGTMLGSIYGGGRLASVGVKFTNPTDNLYGQLREDDEYGTYGHITVNISGGTIGNDDESILVEHTKGGNIFGGSMGRLYKLDGTTINDLWPKLGTVKTTKVNIYGNAVIKSNVYGGGEFGMTRGDSYVTIGGILGDNNTTITSTVSDKPTIKRDVYGGGYGSDDFETETTVSAGGFDYESYTFTPMQLAGIVCGDTYINIKGGQVEKNVYGGGEMATVGLINFKDAEKHDDHSGTAGTSDEKLYGFALSWPYKMDFIPYMTNGPVGGTTHVNIEGGRFGISGKDFLGPYKHEEDGSLSYDNEGKLIPIDKTDGHVLNSDEIKAARMDNGDVFGAGKGIAGPRYDYAFCANVKKSIVNINLPSISDPSTYKEDGSSCITGSVYAGGENGHVIEDTEVTLTNGLIGHSIYGGGKGKDTYKKEGMKAVVGDKIYTADIYSVTAGKVYGNTNVKITGGYVVRNVYGGGNMASVGKGNYSCGTDDYYPAGYGETLINNATYGDGKLWTPSANFDPSKEINSTNNIPTTMADYFLSSGKTKVEVTGGTVGYIDTKDPEDSMKDGLPYGNIFGGCRGESAPNVNVSPRYLYVPLFYSGYVNETNVIVGTEGQESTNAGQPNKAPLILGSVYGGGQDGHVRRDTHVTVYSGEIGKAYTYANRTDVLKTLNKTTVTAEQAKTNTSDLDNPLWLHRGNVYGSGSGIGKYKFDFDADGNYTTVTYNGNTTKEEDYSTSAGSVTRFTEVDINGGIIHRNVYGGGSYASVGPPPIPPYRSDMADKKGDATEGHGPGWQSQTTVIIKGTIGTPDGYETGFTYNQNYGGEVYGASRGMDGLGETFANTVWTLVKIKNGATIMGNVFGGGDAGMVKKDSEVIVGD